MFSTKFNASDLASAAEEHAKKCTEEENRRRAENGRQSNVAHVFEEEDAATFLYGAKVDGNPSTPSPFAYA